MDKKRLDLQTYYDSAQANLHAILSIKPFYKFSFCLYCLATFSFAEGKDPRAEVLIPGIQELLPTSRMALCSRSRSVIMRRPASPIVSTDIAAKLKRKL
jgi:hypothetical protein